MAKKAVNKEEVALDNSKSGFTLVGEFKLTDNTFPPESESDKTKFISRRLNLGVKVDEGRHSYAEMFGGFHGNNPRDITAFTSGKDGEKGNRIIVPWEDRLSMDESTVKSLANFSVITVAIERDEKGKLFYKKFLSAYDAIPYIEAHLNDGDKIKVTGKLTPNYYNGNTTLKKEITYIALAKEDETPTAEGFISVLVDSSSIGKTRIKQDDELDITGYVVAYTSKLNNIEVKKSVPYPMNLVLPIQSTVEDKVVRGRVKRILELLKIKGDSVCEFGFKVVFEEGVMVKEATLDDLDKDSLQLVEDGILSLEDAIGKISVSGGRMNRVVIVSPNVKKVVEEGNATLKIDFVADKYKLEDIAFDLENYSAKKEEKEEEVELNEDDLYTSDDDSGTDVSTLLSNLGIEF